MTARVLKHLARRAIAAAVVATAVAVAVAVAVAGCGTAASSTPVAAVKTSRVCRASMLRVLTDTSVARDTAAGTYLAVDFINTSLLPCVLRGYPPTTGVSGIAGDDKTAAEIPGTIKSIVLPPNYTAHTWVLIARAASGQSCTRFTAKGLRVFIPHSKYHVWLPYPFTACAAAGRAELSVRPVMQGLASLTTFP